MALFTKLQSKLPKKRWKRILLYAASSFFILLAADMALTTYWRGFTISRETTYITAPLFPEGSPDYVTWLNQRWAQGVTPDNNAAVPLIKAIGMPQVGGSRNADWEARMWRGLGLPQTDAPGRILYFVTWAHDQTTNGGKNPGSATQPWIANADPKWQDEETKMYSAPWSAAEHPLWAQWLAAQPEVLALAHEAAGRERYYMPLFAREMPPHPGQTFATLLPTLGQTRYLGRMLLADAMMHATQRGDAEKAAFLRDMNDVLRLGTLLRCENSPLITNLVGTALMQLACEDICKAVVSGNLQGDDARSLLAMMNALPPIPPLDLTGERCGLLDLWCSQAVYGLSRSPLAPTNQPKAAPLIALLVPVRFESQLRLINQGQDQFEAAMRLPSYQARVSAVDAAQRELYRRMNKAVLVFSGYQQTLSMLGDALWASKACAIFQTEATRRDLTRLALALAIYHADKGNYPPTLDALTGPSGILKEIPLDGFTDQPLLYRLDKTGYLLYSVGKDLHDDSGDADKDVIIRMER